MLRMLTLLLLFASPSFGQAEAPATTHALDRVAVLGASLSAGANNAGELGLRKDVGLGVFLRAMIADKHAQAEVHDFGSTYFYMNPLLKGPKQLASAMGIKPTTVVAGDLLFWYSFGDPAAGDPRRMAGLQSALQLLETIECNLIIGDLPRIEHALRGVGPFGGPLVRRSMFPSEEERAEMNRAIHAWAAAREHVTVLPLAGLIESMLAKETMEIEGNRWELKAISDVLQKDLLHPNVRGTVWSTMTLATAMTNLPGIAKDDFRWDESAIHARVIQATAEARAKAKASRERSERRRREREEAKQKAKSGSGK